MCRRAELILGIYAYGDGLPAPDPLTLVVLGE